jgi:membrane protease YdiL (CAAX protease family)
MLFFKNAAKGRQSWYLYLVTVILVSLAYILGQMPMTLVLMNQMQRHPEIGSDALLEFQANPDFTRFYLDTNTGFILLLLIFLFALLGLFIGVRYIHGRPFRSLISWTEKIDWKRILWSFGIWVLLTLIFEWVFFVADQDNYEYTPPDTSFLWLILISLFILPIQTSFEELLFRGYAMQGIGWHFRKKWLALLVTTVLFVLVHSMNPEIEKYGLFNMLPYYLIAGVFLGYITIMDGRLELALGVHAATNFFGAVLVNYEGAALQTGSLFRTATVQPLLLSGIFLLMALMFIWVARKRYRWPSMREAFRNDDFDERASFDDVANR